MATADGNLKDIQDAITEVLESKFAVIEGIVSPPETLRQFASLLRQAGIIDRTFTRNPNYSNIIDRFICTLPTLATIDDIETHCQQLIDALRELGGKGARRCADMLSEEWRTAAKNIGYSYFMDAKGKATIKGVPGVQDTVKEIFHKEPSDPAIARDVLRRNIDKIVETTSRVEETLAMKLYKYGVITDYEYELMFDKKTNMSSKERAIHLVNSVVKATKSNGKAFDSFLQSLAECELVPLRDTLLQCYRQVQGEAAK